MFTMWAFETRFTFPLKFKKMKQSIEPGKSSRHERISGALLLSTPPGPRRTQGGAVFVPPELQHRWRLLPHRGVQHTHEDFLGDLREKTWLLFPPNFLESSVEQLERDQNICFAFLKSFKQSLIYC